MDKHLDVLVKPMHDRLAARGESLYVNLCYVDFDSSPSLHATNPDEYAEFILAAFQHIETDYGFVPDGVEVILEADLARGWNAARTADVILATGQRLAAAGYTPDFIAASVTSAGNALSYFDQITAVPGVSDYLTELSYHRYDRPSSSTISAIGQRGKTEGVATSMLEWWNNSLTVHTLHQDLKLGRNSAWQGGVLAGVNSGGSTAAYNADITDPDNPVVRPVNDLHKYLRQYFKYVRRDAVCVEATTSDSDFDPLAWVNADGRYVVVVNALTGGGICIDGLAAGTYGIKYTTGNGRAAPTAYDVDLADQEILAGGRLTTAIPAAGVITIYAKALVVVDLGPAIAIVSPTSQPTYGTDQPTVRVQGTADDDNGVAFVTWTNDRGGAGTAAGTTTWDVPSIPLQTGENVLTFTATDTADKTALATLRVTRDVDLPLLVDPEAPPMEFDVSPGSNNENCRRRVIEWSLAESKKSTKVRARLRKGSTEYEPSRRRWRRVLKLGADGGMLTASVICARDGLSEEVLQFGVMPTNTPAPLLPTAGAVLPPDTPPSFDYDDGSARRSWLEFATTPGFDRVLMKVRAKEGSVDLGKRRWRTLRSRLKRRGGLGTGYWRVRTVDVLRRVAVSPARVFDYDGP